MSHCSGPSTPRDKVIPKQGTSPCSNGSTGGWTPGPVSPSPPGVDWPTENGGRQLSFEPKGVAKWMLDEASATTVKYSPPLAMTLSKESVPYFGYVPPLLTCDPDPVLIPEPLTPTVLPNLVTPLAPTCDTIMGDEADARQRIEDCVFPSRNLLFTLVVINHRNFDLLKALLPEDRWDNDSVRLALAIFVLNGDVAGVECLLAATAFRGFHRIRVNSSVGRGIGVDDALLAEHGIPLPPVNCNSFIALALLCCKRAMGTEVASVESRTEILKLIMYSRYSCFSRSDEDALLAVQHHSDYRKHKNLSNTLDYWKPVLLSHDDCVLATCNASECLSAALYKLVKDFVVLWQPKYHAYYSRPFRRRVSIVAWQMKLLNCQTEVPLVAQMMEWDTMRWVNAPHKTVACVGSDEYDGSRKVLQKFDKRLKCGTEARVNLEDGYETCVVLGCRDGFLYVVTIRNRVASLGAAAVESLQVVQCKETVDAKGTVWWCDSCGRLVPGVWCWLCNSNWEQKRKALEPPPLVAMDSDEALPPASPSPSPPSASVVVTRVTPHQKAQQSIVTFHCYSSSPPGEQMFDTSAAVYEKYGVYSGQQVALPPSYQRGIVVGLDSKGSLYWTRDMKGSQVIGLTPSEFKSLAIPID
eukprot:TRINITY_DN14757_c0_g1_i1.p1 TRINITY_DN14757_c0_g1~~TRINITY_DN14757_c0_g1_i1.p1  ORF type:complete len:639 (+),score=73.76 TRINITY_DN14757_c0_g1_i1:51-1967(+)